MAQVLSPFPLNVDKIENNGIGNSHMRQMGNWDRETLSASRPCSSHNPALSPLSWVVQHCKRPRVVLITKQSLSWVLFGYLFPAKPAVWSSSASSISVCLSWHKVWSPNVQDWERRWGQLHKSLVKINTFLCKRCLRDVSPKLIFMQQFLHCSGSILGEKGIRHYILEEHWSHGQAVLGTPPERSCLHCSRSVSVHGWAAWDSGWIYWDRKSMIYSSQISQVNNPMIFLRTGLKHVTGWDSKLSHKSPYKYRQIK